MNKYSKRALKTTATVGMSLAMVLSAAAPVMAATMQTQGVCKSATDTDVLCGRAVFKELMDKNIEDFTMDSSETIKVEWTTNVEKEVNLFFAVAHYATGVDAYSASLGLLEAAKVDAWTKAVKDIQVMFKEAFDKENATEGDVAAMTGDVLTAENNMAATTGKTAWNSYGFTVDGTTMTDAEAKANRTNAKDSLAKMNKFASETGAFKYMTSEMQQRFEEVRTELDTVITDFFGDTAKEDLASFVTGYEKVLNNDVKGKETLTTDLSTKEKEITGYTNGASKITLSSKSSVTSRINHIKKNDYYSNFKDEEAVVAILDAYQEILDNIAGLSDLTKDESFVAYTKTKTVAAKKTVKDAIKEMIGTEAKTDKQADLVAADLDNEQFEILKALKEDVLDSAYTFETRKIGNYYVDKSEWSNTVSTTQKTTLTNNIPAWMYTLVDTADGLFGYDVVEKHMNDFNVALEAVTTDIEKITPVNIKVGDKKALVAAEDAIYELTKGDFEKNVTSTEAKSLRAAEKKIEGLREAFDKLGTTTVAGWYDMGNGNWGYNNEDGTPAAYKWVAAGSDWYFVRDGKMARNTWLAANSTDWYYLGSDGKMATSVSVDGCWINSLGIYRR